MKNNIKEYWYWPLVVILGAIILTCIPYLIGSYIVLEEYGFPKWVNWVVGFPIAVIISLLIEFINDYTLILKES